jgi:hypothetical protein
LSQKSELTIRQPSIIEDTALSDHPTTPEFSLVLETLIQTYEALTGLTAQRMSRDAHSRWIEWAYPDGIWAGTTSYDRPMSKMVEKLERQIEDEYQRLEAGHPSLIHRGLDIRQHLSIDQAQVNSYALSN